MNNNFNKNSRKLRKNVKFLSFLKIDISFLLLFIIAYFLDEIRLYFLYVIFISIHELSHFFVAKKYGYLPEKIHFTFFGASLEGYDDFLFNDEIKIILAGPLFNFCMVIFCYLCFWFNPESYIVLNDVLIVNLSILIFNILPVFPLDFGRILLACFSKKHLRKRALEITKKISFFVLIFMFCLFLISFFFEYNFTFGFVIFNLARLLFSSTKETSYKRQFFVFRKLKLLKNGLLDRTIYVKQNTSLYNLFKFIDDGHYFNFVFLNEHGDIVDEISEIELYRKCEFI